MIKNKSIRISLITCIKVSLITKNLTKPWEKITWDPRNKTFCAKTSKNLSNFREAFESYEDRLDRIKAAAAIVPCQAAFSEVKAVVNDSKSEGRIRKLFSIEQK